MPKYIDADELIGAVDGNRFVTDSVKSYVRCTVRNIPAADVEPVRHGRWIPIHELRPDGYPLSVPTCFWCDQCKYSPESPRKFCPNCGAKMDAEPPKEADNG